MKVRPTVRCECQGLEVREGATGDVLCMRLRLLEDAGSISNGSVGTTSAIVSIDFERGVCITLNTLYTFDPSKTGIAKYLRAR